ncbi:MAG TPA: MaoC family dehydratase [Acidimicrobiales bacterium]|nr:MaoC family dehydratase [Acidimicrobiales bacterium]
MSSPPRAGDVLPDLAIEMTPTRVVAGAIATRDFMPVHHDHTYAASQGSPEIFLNIISTNALCSRFVTDWAGPEAMLRGLSIRLGLPAYAGSTITFTGMVTGVKQQGDEHVIDIDLRAATDLGDHATGTATVTLPTNSQLA